MTIYDECTILLSGVTEDYMNIGSLAHCIGILYRVHGFLELIQRIMQFQFRIDLDDSLNDLAVKI